MQKQYTQVVIERNEDGGPGNYSIHGLPGGSGFRKESSFEELRATWLKVEGVALSCNTAELGEHNTLINVTQETENGGAKITFEEMGE